MISKNGTGEVKEEVELNSEQRRILEEQQLQFENDVKLEREAEERAKKIDEEFQTYNTDQKIEIIYTRL